MDPAQASTEAPAPAAPAPSPAPSAPSPSPAPAAPAPAPAPAAPSESSASVAQPAAAAAPAAPAVPKTSLDAAVLGLEAQGLKLDQPLPDDEIVRIGGPKEGEAGAGESPHPSTTTPEPAPGAPASAEPTGAEDEPDLPDPTDAELAQAPGGLRRRFRQVRAQNMRLKELVARVQPAAQQYEQLQSFLSTHELDARSAANALRVAALVQGAINGRVDPQAALEEVAQVAGQLRVLVGGVLPPDVQQRLNEGVIDDATAKEIARLRASRATQARRAELDQATSTTQAAQATAGLLVSAVQTWERAVRARDPDYSRKAKLVETTARALRLERYGRTGMPPNVEAATALAQEAYELVTNELKAALPPHGEVRAPLNGATPSRTTVRAAPTSSLEAAIQGLERMAS